MWVSTDNNMVSESGPTEVRYAPAPQRFDLTDVSREVVMDRASLDLHARGEGNGPGERSSTRTPPQGPAAFRTRAASCSSKRARSWRTPPWRSRCARRTHRGTPRWFDADRGLPAVPHRPHRLLPRRRAAAARRRPAGCDPVSRPIRCRGPRDRLQPTAASVRLVRVNKRLHRRRRLSAAAVVVLLERQRAARDRRRMARAPVSIVQAGLTACCKAHGQCSMQNSSMLKIQRLAFNIVAFFILAPSFSAGLVSPACTLLCYDRSAL